jgi:hypothetical protein
MPVYTKWSSFPSTTATTAGDAVVGLHSGVNERFLVSATPSDSGIALWDANSNISANNVLEGYATTATAAGTTTLTVASKRQQFFTGSTTQTVVLPVTATLVLGQSFYIVNNSTGIVTVQSSGANTVQAMAAGTALLVTCILTSGTTAASWSANYANITWPLPASLGGTGLSSLGAGVAAWLGTPSSANLATAVTDETGTGALVFANTPTLVTPALGVATATSINFGGGDLSFYVPKTSFTPTFTFATVGDLAVAYTTQLGVYSRIGDMVFFNYVLVFTPTFTTSAGAARFSGLPITPGIVTYCVIGNKSANLTFPAGSTQICAAPSSGNAWFNLVGFGTATAQTALTTTSFVSTQSHTVAVSGMYTI